MNRAMAEQTLRSAAVKLVIQIPCLNEEESLPQVLSELPRDVEGFDLVEWLVVDDGSTDGPSRSPGATASTTWSD